MTPRRLVVISAGLTQPSSSRLLADRLAAATTAALAQRGLSASVELIEVRDYAHDLTNAVVAGFPTKRLGDALAVTQQASGLIAVSPIFNASFSGLFKSYFDVLEEDSLRGKPVVIAATGGTERHSLALDHALRPLFTYLRALVVPTGVYAASSDWGAISSTDGSLAQRIARAAGELAEQMSRASTVEVEDPFAGVVPFEQLLAD